MLENLLKVTKIFKQFSKKKTHESCFPLLLIIDKIAISLSVFVNTAGLQINVLDN